MYSAKSKEKPPEYKEATKGVNAKTNWRRGGWKKLKTVTFATAKESPKHKLDKRKVSKFSLDAINGKLPSGSHFGISLIQAARDGLLQVVQSHLDDPCTKVHDPDEDGFTALHHAARYNRVNVLEALLDAGGDMNIKGGQDDMRPLHMASRYNSVSATQYLLGRGADVNARDVKGKTPLHYATRRGHDMVTKMLLSVTSCAVNALDNDFTTPLIMAAVQGNESVCELLISRGADIRMLDINEMTALMWASIEGHLKVTKLLLKTVTKQGKDQEHLYIRGKDNEGNTALHYAVQNGKFEVVDLLLNHYTDVNCQKNNLVTPLHMAATCGYSDIAKLLIVHGAEINCRDNDQMTPIHKAALFNKVAVMKYLAVKGGDINAKDKKNMSPLHCASWKGQTEAVDYLLDNGAQVAESDCSLKSALHWAVQFGNYQTLTSLLKHGGTSILEYTDKNDQTVLHYAAYMGNSLVLRTLLDAGAKTDAKDQEERTPLHIAAQYDNVSCVEALIQASNHETNDDDVDGRTPLLLACMNGNAQVVQVLLSLAADVSKRDDEHCTALMLAANTGQSSVMKILLDNHASVNDVDKMKNTALHFACVGGHVDAVQLLLDRRANVTLKNTHDLTALDLAVDNLHCEVAITMLKHKRSWRDSMQVRDSVTGRTVYDRLIAKLPEAAQVVLDHCVERSTRDDEDQNLMIGFDYKYVDPGPDDPASHKNRYFALNTMVEHERETLLSHPLCQNLLSQKWVGYGRRTFYLNLCVYLGYIISITLYVGTVSAVITSETNYTVGGCPVDTNTTIPKYANTTEAKFSLALGDIASKIADKVTEKAMGKYYRKDIVKPEARICAVSLMVFLVIFAIRDFFKLLNQRVKYFFNFFNWIAWTLVISTFLFIWPIGKVPCMYQWRAGWIAVFFAWINFIMYLRRIDFLGIYVIMFVTVLVSLLKAVIVFLLFVWAFAASFYIVFAEKLSVYDGLLTSAINIIVMTLGEIEYIDSFIKNEDKNGNRIVNYFETDANILLMVFLFLMPIVLMNLMIGIAVGDIEKIQHTAYLKRIALQVDLLYSIENSMPRFIQRKFHVRRAQIRPNYGTASIWYKFRRGFFGSTKNVHFIEDEKKDKTTDTLERIQEELRSQQQRMRHLQLLLNQQSTILQQIGNKLDINGTEPAGIDVLLTGHSDTISAYDNMSLVVGPPSRGRSVKSGLDRGDGARSIRI